MSEKLYIKNIDLEITERCSLKCRHCFNCMQYYDKPMDIPLETIQWEMNALVSALDGIGEVRILGGEPFMNRELAQIVEFVSELPGQFHKSIIIFTNATILPTERQLEVFAETKSRFYISEYDLGKKQKVAEFCELLKRWGIEYEVHKLPFWYYPGEISCNHKNTEELKSMYADCWGRDCITLLNGKLFQCEIMANAHRLKMIPDFPEDYVDLRQKELLKERLDFFLRDMKYMKSCQYCNLTYEKVVPGVQAE